MTLTVGVYSFCDESVERAVWETHGFVFLHYFRLLGMFRSGQRGFIILHENRALLGIMFSYLGIFQLTWERIYFSTQEPKFFFKNSVFEVDDNLTSDGSCYLSGCTSLISFSFMLFSTS